jgi:hypothetical protein
MELDSRLRRCLNRGERGIDVVVNFGWMKETAPIRPLFKSYCYHCSNSVAWHLWRETEWVMFFGAKSFPFLWKNYAVCPGCEFVHHVSWSEYLRLPDPNAQGRITGSIEGSQLRAKNETQKRFLLAQRAEHDAKEKPAA